MLRTAWASGVLLAIAIAIGAAACGADPERGFDAARATDARADGARTDATTGHDVVATRDSATGYDAPVAHDVVVGRDAAPPYDAGGATCTTLTCETAAQCEAICPSAPSGYMTCCYNTACTQYMGACPASTGDGGSTGGTCAMSSCTNDSDCAGCAGGATCCGTIAPGIPGVCSTPSSGLCGGSPTCTPFMSCAHDSDCAGCGSGAACDFGFCIP